MASQSNVPFEIVANLFEQTRNTEALDEVAEHFRKERRYHEMFEVSKASIRHQLELPVLYDGESEELAPAAQQQLEDRLFAACSKVGKLFLADGHIREAWMYLRPLPDQSEVRSLLDSVTVTEQNVDEIIEVCLYQEAAHDLGYRALLKFQGTCNGITFFDTQAAMLSPKVQTLLAEELTHHVHDELLASVCSQLKENLNQDFSDSEDLVELVQQHDGLFTDCGHHLDVTHLAATVRIARQCHRREELKMALALCEYGMRLDPQLKFDGEAPFEQTYSDSKWFFKALTNDEVEQAIDHFTIKHQTYSDESLKTLCQLAIIELMSRTERSEAAIERAIEVTSSEQDREVEKSLSLHDLISLANSSRDIQILQEHFKSTNDLLGFSLAALSSKNDNNSEAQ